VKIARYVVLGVAVVIAVMVLLAYLWLTKMEQM
jgi:Na+-transporting methylmalonyl-CoA/oxaloacetate decarboxylase gamma subunit